jgi:hypothetical protein
MIARARRLLGGAGACATLALAPAAHAAGPPLPSPASGAAGAIAPDGSERLLARDAGAGTRVITVRAGDGRVLRSRRIAGRWSVPAVTLDGGTTGLSADGRVLVLARPTRRFPSKATHLAVLDARRLTVRRRITLPGFFTVDAISPDGRRLYLIQYPGGDFLDYRVRALDTRTGRLAARDIVDPRAPGEQMGGLPMTRAMSRDGRWAYTLYGGGPETFIHALDTVGRTAACIDLDMLAPASDLSTVALRMSPDGRRVLLEDAGRRVATVNARTFAVSAPAAAGPQPQPIAAPAVDAGGFPWPVPLAGAAGLLTIVALLARRRRRLTPPA